MAATNVSHATVIAARDSLPQAVTPQADDSQQGAVDFKPDFEFVSQVKLLQTPVKHMRLQRLWHWQAHWQMAHWYLLGRLTSGRAQATLAQHLVIVCIRAMGTLTLCICTTTRGVRASVLAAVDSHAPAATPQADSTWPHAGCRSLRATSLVRAVFADSHGAYMHLQHCSAGKSFGRRCGGTGELRRKLACIRSHAIALFECLQGGYEHAHLYTCNSNTCGACKCACST